MNCEHLTDFATIVYNIGFNQEPDYGKLRHMLIRNLLNFNHAPNMKFDWEIQKEKDKIENKLLDCMRKKRIEELGMDMEFIRGLIKGKQKREIEKTDIISVESFDIEKDLSELDSMIQPTVELEKKLMYYDFNPKANAKVLNTFKFIKPEERKFSQNQIEPQQLINLEPQFNEVHNRSNLPQESNSLAPYIENGGNKVFQILDNPIIQFDMQKNNKAVMV